MAQAIAAGVLSAGRSSPPTDGGLPPTAVYACNRSAAGRDAMAALGVPADHLHASAAAMMAALAASPAAAGATDVVVVAVKPPAVAGVLAEVGAHWTPACLLLSVAAGVGTGALAGHLAAATADAASADDGGTRPPAPPPPRVVRAMPNVAAAVGASTTTLSAGAGTPPRDTATAATLLAAIGTVEVLPEALQDAATALAGTAPSWTAVWVEALADAGVAAGLPRDAAMRLAVGGVGGAAALLAAPGADHPAVVRNRVESPGGVTIGGVLALERGGVRAAVADAVAVAVAKSRALGGD